MTDKFTMSANAMSETIYALRAFYPDRRVAIAAIDGSNRIHNLRQDARFYRAHAGAVRIDRHVLHVGDFADFPDVPSNATGQKFAEWALLPDGWALA
jgi:hypothetical protein